MKIRKKAFFRLMRLKLRKKYFMFLALLWNEKNLPILYRKGHVKLVAAGM